MTDLMPPERAAALLHSAHHAIAHQFGESSPITLAKQAALHQLDLDYAAALALIVSLSTDISRLCDERNELAARWADAYGEKTVPIEIDPADRALVDLLNKHK